MAISLGTLSVDPIAAGDIARGDVNRAVNAQYIRIDIGTWRCTYDGVAAHFLLSAIYCATLAAVLVGKSFGFFCLDDPDGGRISPASPGRVRVRLHSGDEHDLSAFEVLSDSFSAMAQVAEFLSAHGHPEGALILLNEIARGAPARHPENSADAF